MGKNVKKVINRYDFEWSTMDKTCKGICIAFVLVIMIFLTLLLVGMNRNESETKTVLSNVTDTVETTAHTTEPVKPITIGKADISYEPDEPTISEKEIVLLAMVTMAEAEGECEYGKRLVIDTILNRVDSDYWPDTITDVIYQPNQFSSMWNGRINKCYVTDEIRELVIEELAARTNYDVVYFTAGTYGKYGTPLFQVGNHYFAGH